MNAPPELPQDPNEFLAYKDELAGIATVAMNYAHDIGFPRAKKPPKATSFKNWCSENEERLHKGLTSDDYVQAKTLNHIPPDFKTSIMSKSRKRKKDSTIA